MWIPTCFLMACAVRRFIGVQNGVKTGVTASVFKPALTPYLVHPVPIALRSRRTRVGMPGPLGLRGGVEKLRYLPERQWIKGADEVTPRFS